MSNIVIYEKITMSKNIFKRYYKCTFKLKCLHKWLYSYTTNTGFLSLFHIKWIQVT